MYMYLYFTGTQTTANTYMYEWSVPSLKCSLSIEASLSNVTKALSMAIIQCIYFSLSKNKAKGHLSNVATIS